MQAMDIDQKKSVTISADLHRWIIALRKWNQIYVDVIERSVQTFEELISSCKGSGAL